MTRETTRTTTLLSMALLIAGGFAGCATEVAQPEDGVEVAGAASELRDSDNDGHDDYDDKWRFPDYGHDKHRRNRCPITAAVAQPPVLKVGETTKLKGFAYDNDGPRSLKYLWTVAPATAGAIAAPTSKRTTMVCKAPGVAIVTLTVTDGDCQRASKVKVQCTPNGQPAPVCGDGAKNGQETCDSSSPNAADKCPTSDAACADTAACTTDKLVGDPTKCTAMCTHTNVTACTSGDLCCPSGCVNPADGDCVAVCGDGVKNGTELCDGTGANKCPKTAADCDDMNACTTDKVDGDPAKCSSVCSHTAIPGCGMVVCGDGVKSGNETCDNSSPNAADKCPANCNDNEPCTTDSQTGAPETCNISCAHAPITVCANGDSCCPTGRGCTNLNDDTCTAHPVVCGDGVKDPSEICDSSSPNAADKCPTGCNDNQPCTKDTFTGDPTKCTSVCTSTQINTCDNTASDTCCPAGKCNANTDLDCVSSCGNMAKETGETCDDSSPNAADKCITAAACAAMSNSCAKAVFSGTAAACTAACDVTAITACVSGDGCCAPGCKNPGTPGSTADTDCTAEPLCGNGKLDAPNETCDNTSPTKCPADCNDNDPCTTDVPSGAANTCNFKCTHTGVTTCSSGATQDQCCPAGCNPSNDADCGDRCGDGAITGTETCEGASCPTAASCNDGDPCTNDIFNAGSDACHATCDHTAVDSAVCRCGNGHLDAGETCDPKSDCDKIATDCANDTNACTAESVTGSRDTCNVVCNHAPISSPECLCGNTKLDAGEACDNSSPNAADKCPTTCDPGADKCNPVKLTGLATSCSAKCAAAAITTCTSGDGCCLQGSCTGANDSDCSDPCSTCEHADYPDSFNCSDATFLCENIAGNAVAGPAAGQTKISLCKAVVDCIHRTHCARPAPGSDVVPVSDCLCGTGANTATCFAGAFDAAGGACKNEIAAGAESLSMSEIAKNFFIADFAAGAAENVVETCDGFFCVAECL